MGPGTRTAFARDGVGERSVWFFDAMSSQASLGAGTGWGEACRRGWPYTATLMAHEGALHLVVSNLLSNALKFVVKGVKPNVRIYCERRDEFFRLWVEDNGLGIAPENHEIIFGIFQRLNNSLDYPGTGIGLTLVKSGIERMGGRVGLESELGKGSRFWIEVPAAMGARST